MRRLLAGFPNLGAHDPEGYIACMIEVMVQYPEWAGNRTISKVDESNPQFPPSDRQLRSWLDDAVGPFKFTVEWDKRSRLQLEERAQIEASQEPAPQPQEGVQSYTNYDEAFKAHGRPTGRFEQPRR